MYSPGSRSVKRNAPSSPVSAAATTAPAASRRVTLASATGRPAVVRTVPRRVPLPARATSWRVSMLGATSTAIAAGRYARALTVRVYTPETRSRNAYAPSESAWALATTSPWPSVSVTDAPATGAPSALRVAPARRPVPPRTTSSSTGRPPTVTVTACGWWPGAAAMST